MIAASASASHVEVLSPQRHGARGDLEVLACSFSRRASRRLARHAARARIGHVPRALVVDDLVDVEAVAHENVDDANGTESPVDVSSGDEMSTAMFPLGMHLSSESECGMSNVEALDPILSTEPDEQDDVTGSIVDSWVDPSIVEHTVQESRSPVPPILEVPLPSETWRPPVAGSSSQTTDEFHGIPSWATEEEPQVLTGWEACFYVEYVRVRMEPCRCMVCHQALWIGQMRIGYAPCAPSFSGRALPPCWIHALHCVRRANLAIVRPTTESVAFSPAVSVGDRNRVLDELARLPSRTSASSSRLHVRPWRYLPARLQHWTSLPVPDRTSRVAEVPAHTALELAPQGSPVNFEAHPAQDAQEALGAIQVQEVLAQLFSAAAPIQSSGNGNTETGDQSMNSIMAAVPVQQLTTKAKEPCVICREAMLPGEKCRRLPCLHLFHAQCIDHWMRVKATCPLDNMLISEMLSTQRSMMEPNLSQTNSRSCSHTRSCSCSRSRSGSHSHTHPDSGTYLRARSRRRSSRHRHSRRHQSRRHQNGSWSRRQGTSAASSCPGFSANA